MKSINEETLIQVQGDRIGLRTQLREASPRPLFVIESLVSFEI
jgi:hypothetical protein